jgi:hypothetical protein
MNTMEREREHWKLSERLTFQFANRKDIHARQLDDGRYWLIKRPFTPGLMYLHLKGKVTLGTYLLDQVSRAKFTVLDADDDISGLQYSGPIKLDTETGRLKVYNYGHAQTIYDSL